jgi:selenocysteine lyase/cysteine desulfurase
MDWHPIQALYPVNEELIWLNNCGTVPAGRHVVEAVSTFLEGYARRGVLTETASYSAVGTRIKTLLASLLHCTPAEVSLIHHTAEGMNFFSHGLDLRAGDEVVLLENEYPSNVYPWRHLQGRGVRLVTTPMGHSPEDFLERLAKTITARTRVLSLSAVHWCTGMPLPLAAVGRLCRERSIELVVDGAQGVGLVPLDVGACGIGFMAFSAWKWLMGPLGLAGIYVAADKLETLKPAFVGTASVVDDTRYLPYKTTLKPGADRFVLSTANFGDWVYWLASLELLAEIGFGKVRGRIQALANRLDKGLRDLGCRLCSDRFRDAVTGVTVFTHHRRDTAAILRHLEEQRIVAAQRLGRVRFAPHIYNSSEQMDRVIEVLGDFLATPR